LSWLLSSKVSQQAGEQALQGPAEPHLAHQREREDKQAQRSTQQDNMGRIQWAGLLVQNCVTGKGRSEMSGARTKKAAAFAACRAEVPATIRARDRQTAKDRSPIF
jgi:hypothetical protein